MSTFHFIITMQIGPSRFSWDDTYEVQPGETRQDAFHSIIDRTLAAARRRGVTAAPGDFATLFFSLEPNDLEAGAR